MADGLASFPCPVFRQQPVPPWPAPSGPPAATRTVMNSNDWSDAR
jgi:hypothetical protein